VKPHPRRTRRTRAGFTIVEVVLAMAILLVGMSTILGLLSFGAAMSRTASLRAGAANAVEAVLADLEERLFPLVLEEGVEVVGEPAPIERREIPGHPGLVYSAQATPNPDDPLEYRVDVELSWSTAGSRRTRKFTTLLLREVPFGERLRRRLIEGLEPQPASEAARDQEQP
jgi:general secretion pathway protein I